MWRGGIGYGVVVLMCLQLNMKCEDIWEQVQRISKYFPTGVFKLLIFGILLLIVQWESRRL